MKNVIRLTESDLHMIVKKSVQEILKENKVLDEAYGTMPYSDFLKNVDIDTDGNDDEGMSLYRTLFDKFGDIESVINHYRNRGKGNSIRARRTKPGNSTIIMYLEKMLENLEHAKKFLPMIKKLEIMETGEQPDENYYGEYRPNIPRGLSR